MLQHGLTVGFPADRTLSKLLYNKYSIECNYSYPQPQFLKNLVIYHNNIASLDKHLDEFLYEIDQPGDNNAILTFSETNLKHPAKTLPHYHTAQINRLSPKGGILAYTPTDLNFVQEPQYTFIHPELEILTIYSMQLRLRILIVYRPPSSKPIDSINKLLSIVDEVIDNSTDLTMVTGDLNIDLYQMKHPNAKILLDSMLQLGFVNAITIPTRVTTTSQTLIDHFFYNGETIISTGVIQSQHSDHYTVWLIIPLEEEIMTRNHPWPVDNKLLIEKAKVMNWSELTTINMTADQIFDILIQSIQSLIKTASIPPRQPLQKPFQMNRDAHIKGALKWKKKLINVCF